MPAFVLLLTVFLFPTPASVAEPLPAANRHVFGALLGFPVAAGPMFSQPGSDTIAYRWWISNELANSSKGGKDADEYLLIDGESWRAELGFSARISPGHELLVRVPYISQSGGILDHTIDEFHDLGFPDGLRNARPENRIHYHYARDERKLLDFRGGAGPGDLAVVYQRSFSPVAATGLRGWRTGLEFPTGSERDLTGSGTTDLFLEYWWMQSGFSGFSRLDTFLRAGLLVNVGSGLLDQVREDGVGYVTTGLSYRLTRRIAARVQVDANSPFFDSGLKELGHPGGALHFGLSCLDCGGWQIDGFLSEDLIVDTSPDVVFGLVLRRDVARESGSGR